MASTHRVWASGCCISVSKFILTEKVKNIVYWNGFHSISLCDSFPSTGYGAEENSLHISAFF
jgi:hypothetical protein